MQNLIDVQNKNNEIILKNELFKAMRKAKYGCHSNIVAIDMNSYSSISYLKFRDLNREKGLNIQYSKLDENDDCLNMRVDLFDHVNREYIDFLSHKLWSELSDYSYHNEIPLYSVHLSSDSEWPRANCVHYRENYDIEEMLDDYQPAKIVFCPYEPQDYLFGQSTIGIYFLNDKNHFISKMVIRFFDDKTAPKGCVKLRIPKTVSEFKASI